MFEHICAILFFSQTQLKGFHMKLLRIISAFAISLFALTAPASALAGWHQLTQTERDHEIFYAAQSEIGWNGGVCKVWANHIVVKASGSVVSLPTTTNNGDGYTWNPSADVGQLFVPLSDNQVHIGMIVQMRLHYANGTYGPHTAIIYQKDSTGVTWIESNYSGNGIVTSTRRQTYAQFTSSLESSSSFSIYYIK